MIGVVAFMFAVAIADYLYQRFEFMKQMRMSRQEIRDEHKQSEGDPQVKARLRQIRAERARRRMMAAVPKADVVVTNPTHFRSEEHTPELHSLLRISYAVFSLKTTIHITTHTHTTQP